jgi:ABC-type oligopeptide transport system substrate-binding subunit
LMRLLAYSGQRGAALAQYETCCQVLRDELGVEPTEETRALCEQIQTGKLEAPAPVGISPLQTVRGYELRERVGTGGFGEVYRAYQPSVGRQVAVKVILPQYADHPDFIRRFEREAQLVARLEHPHIVPLYDYWRQSDGAYLVMRWLRGGSLRGSLQRGPWRLEAAIQLLDQVASALTVAHRQGVIHRDVKPENILLDGKGNAYLSDFGIAKDLLRSTVTTELDAFAGSLAYISPEQAQSEPVVAQSDLYSLGVVMYEVLTGEHPFAGMTPASQLLKHVTDPLPSLRERRPDLPAALEGVIQRATAKDTAERYPSALAFAAAFREAVSGAVAEVVTPMPNVVEMETSPPPQLPAFLVAETEREGIARPVFVARERELERLHGLLEMAMAGQGQVVFVTGGAGQGKTALIWEFARRAMDAHPDLLVATGGCNAYSGVGDPYLPFREVMAMLTGDIEARWAAGAVTREHAQRLWAALPLAAQALLEHGTALIDIFVPGSTLLSRAAASAPDGAGWLGRLRELTGREKAEPGDLAQSQLFEAYTDVLHTLAVERPLLLVLDDMQWSDTASISLLFHLGRRLKGRRVLIACAYRPEEIAVGRDGQRHPLGKALAEFKRRFGDVWLDLARADETQGRRFVEAFLDTEPNQLGEGFRRALFRHTEGHPLFTVELLRAMQERGDLVQDEDGRWVEGPALDWGTLPARVEGVIEERIGRLEEELRDILSIASVEGIEFTAQVVARVQETSERQLLRALSRELEKRHRLVREGEGLQIGRQRLSRYWFAHALFQQYLYNDLSAGERALLHREIAEVLEELYEGRTEDIVPQLARHYAEAGEGEKAIDYLSRAGDRARLAYAHQEAIAHYERALALLKEQGAYDRAARMLMKLGLTYHSTFQFARAHLAYDEGFALWRRTGEETVAPPLVPGVLRLPWRDPTTIDPAVSVDQRSGDLLRHLFSGLLEARPAGDVVPDVAERWEIRAAGREYVFYLRKDVRWSDGTRVTAADFCYAWKRVLDPATGSPHAGDLDCIKGARAFHRGEVAWEEVGVRVLDEGTLAVELEAPASTFLQSVAESCAFPVPWQLVEIHDKAWTEAEHIVTNGPFRLESWKRGELIVLARNPGYHGRFPGNVERVELLLSEGVGNAVENLALYKADRVDVVRLRETTLDRARRLYAWEYSSVPKLEILFIGFDLRRSPFNDSRVRRALALSIDREALTDMMLGGYALPATGGFVPPGVPGHSPGIGPPYDSRRARHLLAEAGYPGGKGFPTVEALTLSSFAASGVCQYLQAQWREELGVTIAWEILSLMSRFVDRVTRDLPQVFIAGYVGTGDPAGFLDDSILQAVRRWQNKAYSDLVERARRAGDQAERVKLYAQADRILVEEAAIVPLWYGREHLLIKPWVTRWPVSLQSYHFWKDVIIEPHE